MLNRFAIGVDDFKALREENYFYIDKTKFIEEICNNFKKSLLFTRPRRFGKTLNMSMLRYFFDIENSEENRKLFKGLYIENSEAMKYFGQYPVIFISFKSIKSMNIEELYGDLDELFSNLYSDYYFLFDTLKDFEKKKFNKILESNTNISELKNALSFLIKILHNYYNKKVIILIDEYDIPIISSYVNNYYKEAISLFKSIYTNALKTNENLELGVMTGIVRVAQAGIFSDLNNLRVYTILKQNYDEYFGFTEDDVKYALKTYNLENTFDKIKYWYDGYKFGNTEIYNPWSILSYLEEKNFIPYWVNTSSNDLIMELLKNSDKDTIKSLNKLLENFSVTCNINENVKLTKNLNEKELWEFLLFSGYLTIDEKFSYKRFSLKIVNNEIKSIFKDLFVDIVFSGETVLEELKSALDNKNLFQIHNSFQNLLLHAISFWDIDTSKEQIYQNILSSFMYGLESDYRVISNKESGFGRTDIMLEPVYSGIGYIFELKLVNNKENPLEQIDIKKYETELRRRGVKEIIKLGFVFDGKKVEMIK